MLLNPRHSRIGPVGRAWRGFRRWRVSRPFWGGLLTLLAGLEIFGTTQMGGDGLRVQMGPTGFLSWLIPTILVVCGLLLWITPQQRLFYAVIAVMTAVFSLVGVNLGGFLIGLLLGVVGGALGFAWTPTRPASGPAPPGPDAGTPDAGSDAGGPDDTDATYAGAPDAGGAVDAVGPDTAGGPDAGGPAATRPRAAGPLVGIVVLACLAAAGLTATGPAAPANATPAVRRAAPAAGQGAECQSKGATSSARPGPSTPAASATAPAPSPSAAPAAAGEGRRGNLITDIIDRIRDLFDGDDEEAAASPEPTPEPTPSAPAPGPSASKTSAPTSPNGCPTAGTPANPTPTPGDESSVPRLMAEPDQPLVNREPSRLTGSKVTMYGLRLDGIVDLPTIDGPLRTLRFSMRRAVTDDFVLRIPGPNGQTLDIRSSALAVEGDVKFYATSFTGRFLGIPLTLTPDSPIPPDGIPLTLPLMVFDDPQMRLVFVECNKLTAPNLVETFR